MTPQQLHDNRIRIGQQIAAAREAQGLRQQDLAELTGMKQTNIARIELGKFSFGVDSLSKISAALGREIIIPAK
jgi:transcriptional regulator with XRE-family HTH domain